jgi:hypothetical protein
MTSFILQDLRLPQVFNELSEEERVDIACAIEEGNCLQAEVDLASRRCRQFVFAAHKQALLADKLNAKLGTVKRSVNTSVRGAVASQQASRDNEFCTDCKLSFMPTVGKC